MQTDSRVVVISGASSGIGRCAAERLGKMGNVVFAGARTEEAVARLTSMENVRGVQLDITCPEDVSALAERIQTRIGYVDVLINNAGVPGWGAIMDREVEYFTRVMEVNLFGHVQMIKSFYPLLKASLSSPIIINTSSQAGNYALPFWAPYHMSKWALEAFSDCLRRELQPVGIRVAVIQPGAIRSAAFDKQRAEFDRYMSQPPSEFQARALSWLRAAFERPPGREKEPRVFVHAIMHAIYNQHNKLYYQPGRRLVPDLLAAKLPQRLVDTLIARWGTPSD